MTNDVVDPAPLDLVRALNMEMRTVREDMRVVRQEMREFREAFGTEAFGTEAFEHIMQPSLNQLPSIPADGDPNSERNTNEHSIDWFSEMLQADTDFPMNFAATFPSPPLDLNPQPDADGSPYQFPLHPPPHGWFPVPGASQTRSTFDLSSQANLGTFTQGSSRGQTTRETREMWEDDWNDDESQEEME
jgi:hypothetical protein